MENTTTLDLVLLGLIASGIDTPYRFRERAKLSLGATLPALKRLEAAGFVERKAKGARNKQQYTSTRAGRNHLRSQLKVVIDQLADQPNDCESILRTVGLAASARNTNGATSFLRSAAQDRERRATLLRNSIVPGTDLPGRYAQWLSLVQSARLQAEAEELAEIASELSSQKTARRSHPRVRPRK